MIKTKRSAPDQHAAIKRRIISTSSYFINEGCRERHAIWTRSDRGITRDLYLGSGMNSRSGHASLPTS